MTRSLLLAACVLCLLLTSAPAAELHVGAREVDITPDGPAALSGQFHLRVSRKPETPLKADILVLESREGDKAFDCAVMISCDVVGVGGDVIEQIRQEVKKTVPELDVSKLIVSATHTHTAPVLRRNVFVIPKGVMTEDQYRELLASRLAEGVAAAWKARRPGSVGWGLSHAVIAYNRRASYANGRSQMYGKTDVPDFRHIEGYEDHDVNTLLAWDARGKCLAAAVNISCTAQEVEGRTSINADFWHPARALLRKRYGEDLCVLGLIGAAGDQSPHLMYRKAADERMMRLRGLGRLDEIARRIDRAVEEAYDIAAKDSRRDVQFVHKVEKIRLPMRLVKDAEYAEAKAAVEDAKTKIAKDPKAADQHHRKMQWYQKTVDRYEAQKSDPKPTLEMELHVLRIGDMALCTNPFELFTDYGIRIKARSRAVQTFVVQLAGGMQGYLPTQRAVAGGHYSAVVHSSLVGPEGGQVLVDKTVELINSLWP